MSSNQYNLYNKLSRVCFVLLNKSYINGDKDALEDGFINGLYDILQTSFDLTVTKDSLEDFVQNKNANNEHDVLAYLSHTLENAKTYTLLNYYFLKFILAYAKVVKTEYKQEFQDLLDEHHVSMRDFAVTDKEYAEIMTGSSVQ